MKRVLLAALAVLLLSLTVFGIRHKTSVGEAYAQYKSTAPSAPAAEGPPTKLAPAASIAHQRGNRME